MKSFITETIDNLKNKFAAKYKIDLSLLIILLVVVQHSFLLKIVGLMLTFLLNFGTIKKIEFKKIPLFYSIIPCIELFKFFLIDPDFSKGHIIIFAIGILYWLSSLMLCWVLYSRVRVSTDLVVERSLKIFVLTNFIFSFVQLGTICIAEGVLNPYNTGHDHPYGISSGDMINGLFHGVHLTNAFVNVMLVFYFAQRKNYIFLAMALFSYLLCGSNYATIVLFFGLAAFFFLSKEKRYSFKISSGIFATVIAFYVFITPINGAYAFSKISNIIGKKPIMDEQYLAQKDKQKFQDQKLIHKKQIDRNHKQYDFVNEPGKKTSFKQSLALLKSHPKYLLFGAGTGRFASALAYNASGVNDHQIFIKYLPHYESELFHKNHKSIFLFMKNSHMIFHSESNIPFSSYNQILGEYGLIGLLCFLIFYVGYFIKRIDKRSYAFVLILVMLFAINLDFFIESMSLLLIFELLMFINIKNKIQVT